MYNKFKSSILILSVFCFNSAFASEEYFGSFTNNPTGEFLTEEDRPLFRLSESFSFTDPNTLVWTTPKNWVVDGASIPEMLWYPFGGPFSGKYLKASVIHDYYVEKKTRTSFDTHRNFYYGMRAEGVSEIKAQIMYWAVWAWKSWTLNKYTVTGTHCFQNSDVTTCEKTYAVNSVQELDLTNPEIANIFARKLDAITKNLVTSNGTIADIVPSGSIGGSLKQLEISASLFRELTQKGSYADTIEEYGVLGPPNVEQWQGIQYWASGEIPNLNAFPNGALYFSAEEIFDWETKYQNREKMEWAKDYGQWIGQGAPNAEVIFKGTRWENDYNLSPSTIDWKDILIEGPDLLKDRVRALPSMQMVPG